MTKINSQHAARASALCAVKGFRALRESPFLAWRAFQVLDPAKWTGIDLLVTINDTFFMMLVFFVAGMFVARSVARRGAAGFVRERALRLGVPFLPPSLDCARSSAAAKHPPTDPARLPPAAAKRRSEKK